MGLAATGMACTSRCPQQALDLAAPCYLPACLQAAIFDLLTSQCDRHAENVFLLAAPHGAADASPRMTLIDNDQMLGEAWRPCGVDSIFLPTTQ